MKIIFFIGRRQIDNFAFSKIKNRENYQFIAIIFASDLPTLTKDVQSQFDQIHVTSHIGKDILSEINIDEVIVMMKADISKINPTDMSIICQDEANVLIAGALRDYFNIKVGPGFAELEVFRNKVLMKERLLTKHIRVPKFLSLDKIYDYSEIVNLIGQPFIIKPIAAAGSLGVTKIVSQDNYLSYVTNNPHHLDYEAEEFIQGKLFHCDTVVQDKYFKFLECGIYTCPNLEFQKGKTLGSLAILHDNPIYKKITDFAQQVIIALGSPDGTHHMELFITKNNELVFLEIGARTPGFLINQMYEKTFGCNPLNMDLEVQAGVEFFNEKTTDLPSFWAIFPIKEGIIRQLIAPQLLSKFEINWTVKVGDETEKCLSNLDFGAILFASNQNYTELASDFEIVANHTAIIY